jgi:hypothetical protein
MHVLFAFGLWNQCNGIHTRYCSDRLSRKPAVRGAVILVSRGGTYSAKSINIKGHPGISSSLRLSFRSCFLHCIDPDTPISSGLNTIAGLHQYGQEIPRWLWRAAHHLDLGVRWAALVLE